MTRPVLGFSGSRVLQRRKMTNIARRILPLVVVLSIASPVFAGGRKITLDVPAYDVPPNSDREICTFIRLPVQKALELGGTIIKNQPISEHSTSHHFIIYAYNGADMEELAAKFEGKIVDSKACLDFAPSDPSALQFIGGAQTPFQHQRFPRGLALQLSPAPTAAPAVAGAKAKGQSGQAIGLVLNSHWINSTSETQHVSVKVTLEPPKHKVKKHLAPIFEVLANGSLDVAPGQVGKTSGQWVPGGFDLGVAFGGVALPKGPACVTMITGHMHRRGTLFTVDFVRPEGTDRLYSNEAYSDPPQRMFPKPMLVRPTDHLAYECTHDNGVTTDVKMGCEETTGVTPGRSIFEQFQFGRFDGGASISGAAKRCSTDADCTGFGTGRCVPAKLVFGFTSDDDMCILPGYYYDAKARPGHECDL